MNIEGTNVFDREWDLLIIIDGCDVGWVREIVPEQQLFNKDNVGSIISVGSGSDDWHEQTFARTPSEVLRRTAFITANPFMEAHKPPSLGFVEDVREWGWESDLGTVPAHKVTNAAIKVGRTTDFDRYVVHYMQPHAPFITRTNQNNREAVELSYPAKDCREPWYQVMRGELESSKLHELYLDNLRYVLEEVNKLCQNFDAKEAIISADHGNGVGYNGLYGHPARVEIKSLREVPWASVQAADRQTIMPTIDRTSTNISRTEQLEALGYQ
ncbi:hypothetical protein [Salinirussus salinus]|uniref:hypothetical protein n=1 Tax=Salinirussus salinus TaxID=1198300 RepID=UPI00135C31AC|nr:hypothetical protein [Salinirussus salinus]